MIDIWKEKLITSVQIMLNQANYIDRKYNEKMYKEYGEYIKKISYIILNRAREIEYGETIHSMNEDISWEICETIDNSIGILWSNIFEDNLCKKSYTMDDGIDRAREIVSEEIYTTQNDKKLIKGYIDSCKKNIEKVFDFGEIVRNLQEGMFKGKLNNSEYDSWIEGQSVLSVILFLQSMN